MPNKNDKGDDSIVVSSKVDRWIVIVLAIALIVLIYPAIEIIGSNSPRNWVGINFYLIVTFLTIISVVLVGVPCKYTLAKKELLIQCGVIKYKVAYGDITEAKLSRNPLSAPAWSLDRIQIKTRKSMYLISPKNRDHFLAMILRKVEESKE
ncbi:MAG: PH domain-containing protein [Akkermansiaceae bacterium]